MFFAILDNYSTTLKMLKITTFRPIPFSSISNNYCNPFQKRKETKSAENKDNLKELGNEQIIKTINKLELI